jgi:anti-repressor protein
MSNLTATERNGVLVVDSRLIALELGINHGDWFKNVLLKYQQEIEADFGVIGFENGKPLKASKGGRPERFAWLSEEQATVLMTMSRNTEQVRRCKRQLVRAFAEAKKVIQQTIPAQAQEIEKLKLELELAKTQERLLTTTSAITTLHGSEMVALILGKPEAVITARPELVV